MHLALQQPAFFQKPIRATAENEESFTLACLALHNYLRLVENAYYYPAGFVDSESNISEIIPGIGGLMKGFATVSGMSGQFVVQDKVWVDRNERKSEKLLKQRGGECTLAIRLCDYKPLVVVKRFQKQL